MKKTALFLLAALLVGGCRGANYKIIGTSRLYVAKDTDNRRILMESNLVCPSRYPVPCQTLFFKPGTKLPDAFPLSSKDIDNLLFYRAVDISKSRDRTIIREDCRIYPTPPETPMLAEICINVKEMNELLRPYHNF